MGLFVFVLGAMIAALSPDIWFMSVARFIQGIGAAAIIPIGMAFVGEKFPKEERGRALGLWGMVSASAPAIGPFLGGCLIDWFGWRSLYWFAVILGLLAVLPVWLIVKETKREVQKQSFDFLGAGLMFLGIGSLLVAKSGALLGMGFRFDFRGVRWGGLNYDLFCPGREKSSVSHS